MLDEPGLPTLGMMMFMSCVVLGVTTNRKFGHKTFHSPREPVAQSTSRQLSSSSRNVKGSNSSSSTSRSNGFEDMPESGMLEVISFLSPADLVGIATVSTDFCLASCSESLWRMHCERVGPHALQLGEAWRIAQHQRHRHQQHHSKQQDKRGHCLLQRREDRSVRGAAAVQRQQRCRCGEQGQQRGGWWLRHLSSSRRPVDPICNTLTTGESPRWLWLRWSFPFRLRLSLPSSGGTQQQPSLEPHPSGRSTALLSRCYCDSGSSDRLKLGDTTPPSPRTNTKRDRTSGSSINRALPSPPCLSSSCSCRGFVYGCYSWREAFFRAHRAKPQDLLQELSAPNPPSSSAQQLQRASSSPPRRCIVVLHGRVHDITEFLPSHPGGDLILHEHSATDATQAFER